MVFIRVLQLARSLCGGSVLPIDLAAEPLRSQQVKNGGTAGIGTKGGVRGEFFPGPKDNNNSSAEKIQVESEGTMHFSQLVWPNLKEALGILKTKRPDYWCRFSGFRSPCNRRTLDLAQCRASGDPFLMEWNSDAERLRPPERGRPTDLGITPSRALDWPMAQT
jgi:hypothetical protein